MSIYDIPGIVAIAYTLATTPTNIQSCFRVTGIYPFNRDVFKDYEFAPSFVTDRPLASPTTVQQQALAPPITSQQALVPPTTTCSTALPSPEDICPFPKADPRKLAQRRRKCTSAAVTDTPVKAQIENETRSADTRRTFLCD